MKSIMVSENKPLVSVVVPNYNYARFLTGRIESVLNQTFQDFELILLDDASTDGSVEILRKYEANPKVSRIIINEKNTGSPFVQWMRGIQAAEGKWVWIAEADDLSSPDFLSVCMECLAECPQAIACVTGSFYIDSLGRQMQGRANYWDKMKGYADVRYRCFDGQSYAAHKLYWSCCVQNTSATVFLREAALGLAGSPFLSMRSSGDWLFWFQMAMQGDMVEIYENLNRFRQHETKVTVRAGKEGLSIKEDIEIVRYMEGRLPLLGRYKRSLCHGMLWHRFEKLKLKEDVRQEIRRLMADRLGSTQLDHKVLNINRYLRYVNPWLLTFERDRGRKS